MPIFKSPIVTREPSGDGRSTVPCYTFEVDYLTTDKEDHIQRMATIPSDTTMEGLAACLKENESWWKRFIGSFLLSSSNLFAKPYTYEQIQRLLSHVLLPLSSPLPNVPCMIQYRVLCIKICNGKVYIHWSLSHETVLIDLPDECPDPLKMEQVVQAVEELEEVDVGALPAQENDTVEIHPTRLRDKQIIRETRLKAKLAIYKAQYQMRQYYDKYGVDYSESDSDVQTSEEESEEEWSDEEVQM